ncbi:MAG: sporulation protein YqfD [Bacillota bacterium]
MLTLRLWYYVTGYLEIRIHGPGLEEFVNCALARGLFLWRVRRDGDTLLARVGLGAFPQLWPLAKKTSCRLRLAGKYGLPFVWRHLRRRRLLPVAAMGVAIAIFVFTRFIWLVEVTGAKQVSPYRVLEVAAGLGLQPGVPRHMLDLKDIEHRLVLDVPGISWAKVRLQGIRAIIDIVEKVQPPLPYQPVGPGDIVASRDGIVSKLLVLAGEPAVREGQTVTAGQLLIRGVLGGHGIGYGQARGQVKARVWYQAYCEVPYRQLITNRTGRSWVREVVAWLDREIIWKGREEVPFEEYEVFTNRRTLPSWRNIRAPVELITYTYYELQWIEVQISPEEALQRARENAEASVRGRLPPGAEPGELVIEVIAGSQTVGVRATLAAVEEIGSFRPAGPP